MWPRSGRRRLSSGTTSPPNLNMPTKTTGLFTLNPTVPFPFMNTESATQFEYPESRAVSARLSKVKKSLVRRFADEFSGRLPLALIRRAVEEADVLARATGYPHLVLPVLAEETV